LHLAHFFGLKFATDFVPVTETLRGVQN